MVPSLPITNGHQWGSDEVTGKGSVRGTSPLASCFKDCAARWNANGSWPWNNLILHHSDSQADISSQNALCSMRRLSWATHECSILFPVLRQGNVWLSIFVSNWQEVESEIDWLNGHWKHGDFNSWPMTDRFIKAQNDWAAFWEQARLAQFFAYSKGQI